MTKIFNKQRWAFWLSCMSFFLIISTALSATTYTIERTLNVKQAYKFTNDLGIKANASGGKVEVRMYAKDYYTTGGRSDTDALLYGAYTNSNSTTNYYATAWDIAYTNYVCAVPVLGTFYCILSGTDPIGSQKSTTYKDRVMQVAKKLSAVPDGEGGFVFFNTPEFQVKIELEVNGTTTLDDIYDIKLPGIENLVGLEFDPAVQAYTNPCPSAVGCDAVADFMNVSNAANKEPIVIAHRGYHGMRGVPENSLAAVQKAYDEGFRYVEVDLRMTADYVPIIFHDDFYGYATDFTTLDNTNAATFTEALTWSQISALKYRDRYWDQTYKTATNNSGTNVQARVGSISSDIMTSFAVLCDYIKGKDIVVYLDIKSVPTSRNLENLKQCILIAAKKNVLHQIAVKMVRTNLPDDNPKKLLMPLDSAKQYLGNVYTAFKNDLNVHVVDYDPSLPASFINDWINEGNVVGFEFDIQYRPMFNATSLTTYSGYSNKSVWKYTKDLGYRTGIWSSTALDPRGRPGHDPSKWGTGGVMDNDINTWQHYKDNRARLEVLSLIAPQYITHDRPDEVYNYLNAVNKINTNTKR